MARWAIPLEGNGNGWLEKVRIVSTIINNVGVSTILVGLLVAWLFGWLSIPMLTRLADNIASLAAADHEMRAVLVRVEQRQIEGLRLIAKAATVNCQNVATDLREQSDRIRAAARCDTIMSFVPIMPEHQITPGAVKGPP